MNYLKDLKNNMPKITMTFGLCGSGKSTWSRIQKAKRINKDELRVMIDNGAYTKDNERLILECRNLMMELFMDEGYDVILDDCNFNPYHKKTVTKIINQFNLLYPEVEPYEFEEKIFTTPMETCIERDSKREKPVGEKVIRDMWEEFGEEYNIPSL
ncbi:MAG: AAA family ATPase [Clostridiales bacterium]|nr:AAA family ATPase [Clostridiales bacterium]